MDYDAEAQELDRIASDFPTLEKFAEWLRQHDARLLREEVNSALDKMYENFQPGQERPRASDLGSRLERRAQEIERGE